MPGLGGQGQVQTKAKHPAARKSPRVRPTTHPKVLLGERRGNSRGALRLTPLVLLLTRRDLGPSPQPSDSGTALARSDPGYGETEERNLGGGSSSAQSQSPSSFWLRQSVSNLLLNPVRNSKRSVKGTG